MEHQEAKAAKKIKGNKMSKAEMPKCKQTKLVIEDSDDEAEPIVEVEVETIVEVEVEVETNIKNKGTGAGGANTNLNGLSFEATTNLEPYYSECIINKNNKTKKIKFNNYNKYFINANKSSLHKYMDSNGEKSVDEEEQKIELIAGCKEPDEAYINLEEKKLYIIEKKYQQTPGSVDEKIQTGHVKQQFYEILYPNYKINYMYCLSDWFNRPEYKSVLQILKKNNVEVFWGNDEDYKTKIINFMCN